MQDDLTQNINVLSVESIVPPRQLDIELPNSDAARKSVLEGRGQIRRVLSRQDKRLLVIVGPCSVHDPEAAIDYARRLLELRNEVEDKLLLVMRVYFEKPRTVVGWKGLINDPHLDGTFDISHGLRQARTLLRTIAEMGLPCGTELLEPILPQYIDDFVSWAAIGARTTESQTHRQMASGLSMPVGYKNSTDGSVQVAIDAFRAARSAHHFLGIDEEGRVAIVKTRGNSDGHIILRGGKNKTNYDGEMVAEASAQLAKADLATGLMVDCSHANSGKQHENQLVVWDVILDQLRQSESPIIGAMLESNINPGRQEPTAKPLEYGVSVTDACIGWADTAAALRDAAHRL